MKAIYFFVFALLLHGTGRGQPFYFRHYQVENGLSHNTVTCSLQDKTGFLWFGTKDGLNRFDGYAFKTFRKAAGKPGSIGSNYIHSLYEDSEGTLWVGTEKGLYQYLAETEEFRLLPAASDRYIDKIIEDKAGRLWLLSANTLCRYAKGTGQLDVYEGARYFTATGFCTTPDGTLWVGTGDGQLKRYDPKTDSFWSLDLFAHSKPTGSRWIESLYATADGHLLAGTSNTEIKIIDPSGSTYSDVTLSCSKGPNLYIRSVLQTAAGEFWLGTESGVFVYNTKTGTCLHLNKEYSNPYSLSDNAVYTFCRDREGGVWVGTYFGGLNYLPAQHTPFTKYFPGEDKNSLNGNVVREIKKDRYGNLWIGTEDAGLNKLDSTGRFTHFAPDATPGSISFFNIHGLLTTGDELWIGTFHHGLDVMNVRTGKVIRHFEAGPGSELRANFIYCFYQTAAGRILIGTVNGINTYNRETNKVERLRDFPPQDWYTSIAEDESGTLWTGTFGKGVHWYNPQTGKGGSFTYNAKDGNSLSSDRVNAIFKDRQNTLWFATEEGLCRWNAKDSSFTRYGTATGFPSDFVLSILEDDQGSLWVSTTKGLVRFDPASGKAQVYTKADGLLSDQFNYSSAFKDAGGRLYFGSAKGLVSFRPTDFTQSKFTAPLYITGFQLNGQDITAKAAASPLKQSITYTDKITLPHHQSTFSIDFAALSFTAPETVQYLYQMQGLSNNWINLKGNRRVDFIGLPPGTYTFRVKAFATDGGWSKETKLAIEILPPWWSSAPAQVMYALLVLLAFFLLVRSYHKRMEAKAKQRFEQLQTTKEKEMLELQLAKEKELLQAKIEFFTNVAHEIKTPLTLIKVPLTKIMKKAGGLPDIENGLNIMSRNTARLIELTNQLLDFRQTEINKFRLSVEQTDVAGLVAEACAGFIPLAEQSNIVLSLQLSEAPFFAFVDSDAFNKIIANLFSNAVKYAGTRVCIVLLPSFPNKDSFTLKVTNDGFLIPEELKEKIFEPFYRIPETEIQTGSGIGLALARSLAHLHNGTLELDRPERNMNVFSLTLPVHNKTESTPQAQTPSANPSTPIP